MRPRIKETHMLAIKNALETTYDSHEEIGRRFEVSASWVGSFAKTYRIKRPTDYNEIRREIVGMKVAEARQFSASHHTVKTPDEGKISKLFGDCRFTDMVFKPAPYIPLVFS